MSRKHPYKDLNIKMRIRRILAEYLCQSKRFEIDVCAEKILKEVCEYFRIEDVCSPTIKNTQDE